MTERKISMPKLSLWLVRLIANHQVQTRMVLDPMLFASWYAMGSDLLDWPEEAQANPLNGGFVSDLSEILLSGNAPDLWLHGHVHDGFDYTIGCARVVANLAGYIRNRRSASSRQEFEFENATLYPCMVLEV